MQPGIIYNYLSILKAEQLALIEGKELWVAAGTVYISGSEQYPFQWCHNEAFG